MDKFFEYAVSEGLKPRKVPFYEEIYYGIFHGYAVTLFRFYYTGSLVLCINTALPTPEDEEALKQFLLNINLKEKYHIEQFLIKDDFIELSWNFYPDPKDEKEFISFVEWFFPLLPDFHATNANICTECGCEIKGNSGRWCHTNGSFTRHIHKKCCGSVARKVQQTHAFFPRKKIPTYKAGILGSFLAIFPIVILWAYVFRFAEGGTVVTSLGMGFLSWLGYTFNFGFRGTWKPLIVLGTTMIGLRLGTLLLPLFGSIPLLPPDSTAPSVLVFTSYLWAVFIIMLICIVELIFYANEKRDGSYGIKIWK